MEGPTPVSALIHAATMVAAGVYLVGRFYPLFTPEVLTGDRLRGLHHAFRGRHDRPDGHRHQARAGLFHGKPVGLHDAGPGLGGWLAGMFHLFTHAFFKSLLFLCSGSVIHACGTNEMPKMGGLRRKMPYTALTMLIGCLAIAGAGIPAVVGLSGFHSKDYIIAQCFASPSESPLRRVCSTTRCSAGACATAFDMFRLWFMTFAGQPRDGLRLSPRPRIAADHDRAAHDPGRAGDRDGLEYPLDLNLG